MFEKIKSKARTVAFRCRAVPKCYIIMPMIVVAAALIIRLTTGGTHLIYNALDSRGIFFGPFLYSLFYTVRLILSTVILTYILFSRCVINERGKSVVLSLIGVILLLLEFKLIFGGVSLVLSVLFAVISPLLFVYALRCFVCYSRAVFIMTLVFIVLQGIHFVQVISLSICI